MKTRIAAINLPDTTSCSTNLIVFLERFKTEDAKWISVIQKVSKGILTLLKSKRSVLLLIFLRALQKKIFKYKLAKAFIRWSREHDLKATEIEQAEKPIEKVNKALQ